MGLTSDCSDGVASFLFRLFHRTTRSMETCSLCILSLTEIAPFGHVSPLGMAARQPNPRLKTGAMRLCLWQLLLDSFPSIKFSSMSIPRFRAAYRPTTGKPTNNTNISMKNSWKEGGVHHQQHAEDLGPNRLK